MGKGYCDCKGTKTKGRTILIPDIVLDKEKWCPQCSQYKVIGDFYAYKGAVRSICKACDHELRNINRRKKFELTGKWQ